MNFGETALDHSSAYDKNEKGISGNFIADAEGHAHSTG